MQHHYTQYIVIFTLHLTATAPHAKLHALMEFYQCIGHA